MSDTTIVWRDLKSLTKLSPDSAKILSQCEGYRDLDLSGLMELSDEAAESLSTYKGELLLNGLTKLSDAAVEFLSLLPS